MKAGRIGVLTAVAVTASACVPLPHRFVHQPGLVAFLTDTARRPVHDVSLYVYAADSRNGALHTRQSTGPQSPRLGIGPVGAPPAMTFLSRQTDWHAVWWLLPGRNRRYFAWCVSAPGFARQGARLAGTNSDTVRVAFVPASVPDLCPERVFNLDEVIAPARRAPRQRDGISRPVRGEPGRERAIVLGHPHGVVHVESGV